MKLAALVLPLGLAASTLPAHALDQQSAACWRPGETASAACVQQMARGVMRKQVPDPEVAQMFVAARGADNDRALADFLVAAAENYELDAAEQQEYIRTAATIGAEADRQRALTYLTFYDELAPANLRAFLEAAQTIDNDQQLATVLVRVAKTIPLDAEGQAAFDRAAATVQSPTVRRTVDQALAGVTRGRTQG